MLCYGSSWYDSHGSENSQCSENPGRGKKSFTDVKLLNSTASSLLVMPVLICFSVPWIDKYSPQDVGDPVATLD